MFRFNALRRGPLGLAVLASSGAVMAQQVSVTLSSPALDAAPASGERVRLQAAASGGTPPYVFHWDLDGDGVVDRSGRADFVEASFPRAGMREVNVSVVDAAGAGDTDLQLLQVRGPRLQITPVGPFYGPDELNPGDGTVAQFLQVTNVGDATQPAGHAMFVPAPFGGSGGGPSPSGFVHASSESGRCDYGWIDLVTGQHATPSLATAVGDGNAGGPLDDARTAAIELSGGFRMYGERYTQAVMSTNGYLSFDTRDTGAAASPSCAGGFAAGSFGAQLRPFHADLIVAGDGTVADAGGGLRHRYFESCPRTAEDRQGYPCHVFSWSGMRHSSAGQSSMRFDFQAVAYVGREEIAYQYRTAPPEAEGAVTIGIANRDGSEAFNASCGSAPVIPASSAICFHRSSTSQSVRPGAVLSRSLVAVPELGIGESAEVMLAFKVSRQAWCGQSIGIDYLGTAWEGGQVFAPERVLEKRVAIPCRPPPGPGPIGVPPPGQQAIPRRSGLYFNAARPGNGLVNFFRNTGPLAPGGTPFLDRIETLAGAWYTALPDRTPVWFTMQGELVEGTGEVPLRKFSNSAAPDGFAPTSEIVGRAWLGYLSASEVGFAWQLDDGSHGIERMASSEFPLGGVNHTQTWFNPGESGWGLAIESLYAGRPFEFVGAFVYDATGAPRWVTGDIGGYAGGRVELIGHRPHCPACPWIVDWTNDGVAAGSLELEYDASEIRGTLETAISLPGPYRGAWTRSPMPIQPVALPAPVPN